MFCVDGFVIFFFFQAEDGIRDTSVTGVQTCALPISVERAVADREQRRAALLFGAVLLLHLRHRGQRVERTVDGGAAVLEIGRASCRERVESSVGGGVIKKKGQNR